MLTFAAGVPPDLFKDVTREDCMEVGRCGAYTSWTGAELCGALPETQQEVPNVAKRVVDEDDGKPRRGSVSGVDKGEDAIMPMVPAVVASP